MLTAEDCSSKFQESCATVVSNTRPSTIVIPGAIVQFSGIQPYMGFQIHKMIVAMVLAEIQLMIPSTLSHMQPSVGIHHLFDSCAYSTYSPNPPLNHFFDKSKSLL